MDGDQLEALREIESAKSMIQNEDYMAARAKLLQVQRRSTTGVQNISEMLIVCHILCAAELTFSECETDWYWVLRVSPAATELEIESQYYKLTTLLDPIKNEFPGTLRALQLLEAAFSVLSVKQKRIVFHSKRFTSLVSCDPMCSLDYTSNDFIELSSSNDKILFQDDDFSKDEDTVKSAEYWVGSDDLMQSSDASDVPEAINYGMSDNGEGLPDDCDPSGCQNQDFYNFDDDRKPEVFAVGQVWAAYDEDSLPRAYARVNNILESPLRLDISWLIPTPSNADEGKWCKVGLPVACGNFCLDEDEETEPTIFSHVVAQPACTFHRIEIYPKQHEVWAIYKDWKPYEWCKDPRSRIGCPLRMVEILEDYNAQNGVKVSPLIRVDGFKNIFKRHAGEDNGGSHFQIRGGHHYQFSHKIPAFRFNGGEIEGIVSGMFELDSLAVIDICNSDPYLVKAVKRCRSTIAYASKSHRSLQLSLKSVGKSQDLMFSYQDFASGDVWAVYDSDCMPRKYVIVNEVTSSDKVSVNSLEPHPLSDYEIDWVGDNLPLVCGSFRRSASTATLMLDRFSHPVNYEKGIAKAFYKIYPKKGEVWAMYRNWNSKWIKSDFKHNRYQIVEIISDLTEGPEIVATSLNEVHGYKTFFKRQLRDGFELIRRVPRSEMLRFSHRVMAFAVPGIEIHGIPAGCLHLEPDALPSLVPF